jgi:rhodanese-related sulfurtransferase
VTQSQPVRVISAEELKAKLDGGDDFRLVNALGEWEFNAKHIPGSEHFATFEQALEAMKPDEDIVVYCSNPACRASQKMYKELVERGFERVQRFEGGLMAWEDAGYPLEGDGV